MGKIIRPAYPLEFSIGLLLLIFAISFFLSAQIFEVTWEEMKEGTPVYLGMFLVSCAVIIMVLVLWEEFLFPIKVSPTGGGVIFRNHRNKLRTQALIYCLIPAIFVFLYLKYDVNEIRFAIWAVVCISLPVAGKLVSGLNNYNDFLRLTHEAIEYRNNERRGVFALSSVMRIGLVRDEKKVLHKVILLTVEGNEVGIDIDEMELDAYYEVIDAYIKTHYTKLIVDGGQSQ